MSREVTAFLCVGSLQSSTQLRTCNPGRERRTPPLVCVARVARYGPEGYFGDLGAWAKRRMKELGVDSAMSRIVYDN